MKRLLALIVLALVAVLGVAFVRALSLKSKQHQVAAAPNAPVDTVAVISRLQGALRIQTVSHQDSAQDDSAAFAEMLSYLERTFPKTHATLTREMVGDRGVLYTWSGVNTALAPLVLMGHLDVVPVEVGTESNWKHPPFAAEIADGFVWGRGTLDDKGAAIAIFEAIESEIEAGHAPSRTILLSIGLDEEVGGQRGAARIAALLGSRHITPWMVLDEGGIVLMNTPLPVTRPVAMIGIAEKGSFSARLTVTGEGGHSSMPPAESPIGILGRAINAVEAHPMPGSLRGPSEQLFAYLAPEMSLPLRTVFANQWLFGPLLERMLAAKPASNAMLRTTTATTMISAGTKENVLAARAQAVVNFRLYPGDTPETVVAHIRSAVNDDRVHVDSLGKFAMSASPMSQVDSVFGVLQDAVGSVYQDALVAPYLVVGGTDGRYFHDVSQHVYRLAPFRVDNSEVPTIHGTNERLRVTSYLDGVRVFRQLLRTR